MGIMRDVQVPDIGDFKDVPVIEVLVSVGDSVSKDTPLVVIETDKATMEVPSPSAGVVRELRVQVGDRLSKGKLLLILEDESQAGPTDGKIEKTPEASAASTAALDSQSAPDTKAPVDGKSQDTESVGIEVEVPDIGDFKDVPVIEVLVKVGDVVKKDTSLVVLETDKATMEVPSPAAGVVRELRVKVGERLSRGKLLLILDGERPIKASSASSMGGPSRTDRVSDKVEARTPDVVESASAATVEQSGAVPNTAAALSVRASPALRKRARELGVDLSQVGASGPRSRVTREDLDTHVRQQMLKPAPTSVAGTGLNLLPWPQIDFSRFGVVERQALSRLRKISGANLARNWAMIPHVTNFDEADITDLEAFRVQLNREQGADAPKLTMLAFLIKASIEVLRKMPDFNASLDGEQLVLKRYFHIGFAADTPNGLVVPVIRDADRKGLLEIARESSELAGLARAGKLKPEHMQGGCFSISSLGGIGGTGFTPIINAPEVAILGVTRAELKPKWDGTQFRPRLMLPLNLSWDHRVIDGAAAARFLVQLSALLADFRRVAL